MYLTFDFVLVMDLMYHIVSKILKSNIFNYITENVTLLLCGLKKVFTVN